MQIQASKAEGRGHAEKNNIRAEDKFEIERQIVPSL